MDRPRPGAYVESRVAQGRPKVCRLLHDPLVVPSLVFLIPGTFLSLSLCLAVGRGLMGAGSLPLLAVVRRPRRDEGRLGGPPPRAYGGAAESGSIGKDYGHTCESDP